MNCEPDFEAEISFLTTEEGGRRTPVYAGYRPNHDFGLAGTLNDAHHSYNCEQVNPGDTVTATLTLRAPEFQRGRLFEGMSFTVQEGSKIIGHGQVTRIFNADLRRDVL